jgi:hypothetical protein
MVFADVDGHVAGSYDVVKNRGGQVLSKIFKVQIETRRMEH